MPAHTPPGTTLLDRLLRPFSSVRPGEGLSAVLLMLCVFLIMCGYYVMKTAREALILTTHAFGLTGQEIKAYSGVAIALLLAAMVPAYGALASRLSRIWLIFVSYAIVMASMLVFFALALLGVPIGLPFYLWVSVINVLLVAQFWSYAADVYTEEQGRRLFAIIAIGGSLGAVLGPRLASFSSTYALVPLSAAFFVPCIGLFLAVEYLHRSAAPADDPIRKPITGEGGFELVARDRYLTLMAGMVLAGALVKTIGDFVLSNAITQHAQAVATSPEEQRDLIKNLYGTFYFWVNLLGFLVQAFIVSRAIKRLGVRGAVLVMPVIALATYGSIAAIGGLALIQTMKVAETGASYSLENTVRQSLFLPTSRATKYKAKAAIDTFGVRVGDTLAALLIWLALHVFGIAGRGLAVINIVLSVGWFAASLAVGRHYRQLAARQEAVVEPPRATPTPSVAAPAGHPGALAHRWHS